VEHMPTDLDIVASVRKGNVWIAHLPSGLLTQAIWDKISIAYFKKGSCLTVAESIAIYETED